MINRIPKLFIYTLALMAALGVGIWIGGSRSNNSLITGLTQQVANIGGSVKGEALNESTRSVKVTRVVDGDTIEIEGGEKVRYIGIDTPETVDPRKPVQCFGVEASKKNKEMVEGKMVRLEKDITDRDKYNRLLRYVWLDDVLVNLELVKQGFAYSYSYPPDIKYQDQIINAQQEAKGAIRGLWSACPVQAAIPAPQENNPSGSCLIKGNISTSGEKIYHLLGCGSYSKTQIDEKRGEKWFCSESEAQAAGWRKALNCP
ncbi:MAG: thermonuclease family protein [bacterium]|nr:thermonuclease family protein [bacterium]